MARQFLTTKIQFTAQKKRRETVKRTIFEVCESYTDLVLQAQQSRVSRATELFLLVQLGRVLKEAARITGNHFELQHFLDELLSSQNKFDQLL